MLSAGSKMRGEVVNSVASESLLQARVRRARSPPGPVNQARLPSPAKRSRVKPSGHRRNFPAHCYSQAGQPAALLGRQRALKRLCTTQTARDGRCLVWVSAYTALRSERNVYRRVGIGHLLHPAFARKQSRECGAAVVPMSPQPRPVSCRAREGEHVSKAELLEKRDGCEQAEAPFCYILAHE